jgi:hypothetical protein
MSVSARVHMPSLGGATEWLNFEPLGREQPDLLAAELQKAFRLLR